MLKPMPASKVVKCLTGCPFNVYFDGACPIKMGIRSTGMHFMSMDGLPLLTIGEHCIGFMSNHSESLGLAKALGVMME